jgi:triacylglycerol esterase/lipase EstA (alpha/beta hydrolase family)
MSHTVYALLVGIDKYKSPVPPLRGCENDIRNIQTILEKRIFGQDYTLKCKKLLNEDAKILAVIDGFRSHLSQAKKDDVALFYYSGHGSQARTHPKFRHLESDGLDETLVCYDSREPGKNDLADKEISKLISEVAKSGAHVIVILDSCHSGSGTRNFNMATVRRVETDFRERDHYTINITEEDAQTTKDVSAEVKSRWLNLPQGRHILLAACRDDEEAKETQEGGSPRGVFSYCLTKTLQDMATSLTYRDLLNRVNALARTRAAQQNPLVEATNLEDMNQPFLGGAIREHPNYFTLRHDKEDGWVIDGGAVHGIAPVDGDETTLLAVFSLEADLEEIKDLKTSIGEARVTAQQAAQSKVSVKFKDGIELDKDMTYKAIVVSTPLAPLKVQVSGNAEGVKLFRAALNTAEGGDSPSLLVRITEGRSNYKLIALDTGFRIRRSSDDRPLTVDVKGLTEESARTALARLEHIARWVRIMELKNTPRQLPTDAVKMDIFLVEQDPRTKEVTEKLLDITEENELRLPYTFAESKWRKPKIRIRLTNTTDQKLFCSLLNLTETYKVWPGMLPNGGEWIHPKGPDSTGELWAMSGKNIALEVPDDFWKHGVIEFKDWMKLIVSTEECNTAVLEQDKLDVSFTKSLKASMRSGPMSTLNRLMQRVRTRDMGPDTDDEDMLPDWYTAEVLFTTVRPQESIPTSQTAKLNPQVTLQGHSKLKANARLGTVPQASRDAGMLRLPAILRDDPNTVQPFEFSTSRSGDVGLSVLELNDIDAASVREVTPQDPLVIHVDTRLEDNQHVLPVAFDGEFFLPLGFAERKENSVAIKIERLPEPTVNARSLFGSIRIFFHKIISERLGTDFEYPLLAVARSDGKGSVTYTKDMNQVKEEVSKANRILLFVHGIIGDTLTMAASAWPQHLNIAPDLPILSDRYDLILTFDYENINTPIEDTARALRQRLEAVGLGENHQKTLHIAAHSMGGLVSRWFIEHEGGNKIVRHLVMLGTPNAGSPWSTVQDWATAAMGFCLNNLSVVAWPVKILGGLLNALELVDKTLDQMHPGSDILNNLQNSNDPGITYSILAGNTSIIPTAMDKEDGKQSLFDRLLAKLNLQRMMHKSTEAVIFFGDPNDIAVSVTSIKNVPAGWAKANAPEEVASDHISYFSTEAGIRALANALKD